jgi:hypothetical protein
LATNPPYRLSLHSAGRKARIKRRRGNQAGIQFLYRLRLPASTLPASVAPRFGMRYTTASSTSTLWGSRALQTVTGAVMIGSLI